MLHYTEQQGAAYGDAFYNAITGEHPLGSADTAIVLAAVRTAHAVLGVDDAQRWRIVARELRAIAHRYAVHAAEQQQREVSNHGVAATVAR